MFFVHYTRMVIVQTPIINTNVRLWKRQNNIAFTNDNIVLNDIFYNSDLCLQWEICFLFVVD